MTAEPDHHEVALDLWLQAEPGPAEQELRDRGGYDYPVPADER